MYKIKLTLKGGNTLMTCCYSDETYAQYLFDQWGFGTNPKVERIDLIDGDFDFVIGTKYNMAIVKHYTVTCKGVTHTYFDVAEALDDKLNLECFFGVNEVQFKVINGEW
jgi:hypothetical protein